jgi:hypothetical protein
VWLPSHQFDTGLKRAIGKSEAAFNAYILEPVPSLLKVAPVQFLISEDL